MYRCFKVIITCCVCFQYKLREISTTSAIPERLCPLNHDSSKDTYAVPALRKHIAVCSQRAEYPLSEYHCRMVRSPG